MSETKHNPLAVYCSYCGAPAEYDIVHQKYHCGYCGGTTDIHEPVQRLGEWRDARKKEVLRDKSVAEEKCVCQNCGAEVVIPEDHDSHKLVFSPLPLAIALFVFTLAGRTALALVSLGESWKDFFMLLIGFAVIIFGCRVIVDFWDDYA